MTGRTNYTAPTNGDAPEGPEQMADIYAHFDALTDATKSTVGSLPATGFSGQEFLIDDSGRKVAWTDSAWRTIGGVVPDPVVVGNDDQIVITATSFAALPSAVHTTLTLPAACWVEMTAAAWLTAVTNDVRMGINVSGATTSAANAPQHGATGYASAGGGSGQTAHKVLKLNAGSNTIRIHAMRTSSGTQTVAYPVLTVTPLRWA